MVLPAPAMSRGSIVSSSENGSLNPLEAARRLAFADPSRDGICTECQTMQEYDLEHERFLTLVHRPTCPWLALPQIVAALEAAEAVLWAADAEMGADLKLSSVFPRWFVRALGDLEIALGEEVVPGNQLTR
jgi:hypothetical protein